MSFIYEPSEANRSEAEIAEGKQTTARSPKGERSESFMIYDL